MMNLYEILFDIAEALVDESKQHITQEDCIDKIRLLLGNVSYRKVSDHCRTCEFFNSGSSKDNEVV